MSALTSAERQRRHRDRNREIDTGNPAPLRLTPTYTAGKMLVHLANREGEVACGATLPAPHDGHPARSRLCVTCLGHAAYGLGLADMVIHAAGQVGEP